MHFKNGINISAPLNLVQGSGLVRPVCAPSTGRASSVKAAEISATMRPRVCGKFFEIGGRKHFIKGVTYGPLSGNEATGEYRTPAVVERDLALMREAGINTLRTYTVPPVWLLDAAADHGLRVIVGLAWEQHVAFLESTSQLRNLESRIRTDVRACSGHRALFGYSIGNEIPSLVVRWYGHRKIENHLRRLHLTVMDEDPDSLVTYVNYPSTEYLELPFLDFASFNVFLEAPDSFAKYVGRLQTIAGDRPLLMSEIGLDSRRHGQAAQARTLKWNIERGFEGGCAGLCIFAWTDEWSRGGEDIRDWEFGLTTRDRTPKLALSAVRAGFANVPFSSNRSWPGISVVVCTYNGSANLRWCLDGLTTLNYPNYEVIVVDDGSTDRSASIAAEYVDRGVSVIRIPNNGLSAARNEGLSAAKHDIVAYIDDDARPDPDWLMYVADSFQRTDHVGIGGPNIPPTDDVPTAQAVSLAPGGPVHVLLTDEIAEHIPGCNMAFRKKDLQAIGGFDPQFRIAGDDVDLCWRLQARGGTLGFNPAAMVWHRRRTSVKAFWKQQYNYGRAEADLEDKWPEKYNSLGHLTWAGRLYRSNGLLQAINWWARRRIYHGTWGSAMFQSVYHAPRSWVWTLPTMPEWYLLVFLFALLGAMGRFWTPLYSMLPLLGVAVVAPAWHAATAARSAVAAHHPARRGHRSLWARTASLHWLQPIARLAGRISRGLTPWRSRSNHRFHFPKPTTFVYWNEHPSWWRSHDNRLKGLELALAEDDAVVIRGGDFDRWDVEVRGGVFASARSRLLIEEHGKSRQLIRLRIWPQFSPLCATAILGLTIPAIAAAADHAPIPSVFFAAAMLLILARGIYEAGSSVASMAFAAQSNGPWDAERRNHEQLPKKEASHPAVLAWTRLGFNGVSVIPSELGSKTRKCAPYRLAGVGNAGGDVIASNCRPDRAVIESAVYKRVLAHAPFPTLRYYGSTPDEGNRHWLFVEDAGPPNYSPRNLQHREIAGRWLGMFHVWAATHAGQSCSGELPDRGTEYFHQRLQIGISEIEQCMQNGTLASIASPGDLEILHRLLAQCRLAAGRWGELRQFAEAFPQTVVHGDFTVNNVRIKLDNGSPVLQVFDWEDAGLAAPAIDLIPFNSHWASDSAGPDLDAYFSVVKEHWPAVTRDAVDRQANVGRLFWHILAMSLDAPCLAQSATAWRLQNMRLYSNELSEVFAGLGWDG